MSPTFLNVTDKLGILIIYVQCLSHLYLHASIEAEALKPAILFFFDPFAFVLPFNWISVISRKIVWIK